MKFQSMPDLPQFSGNRNCAEFGFVPAATALTRLLRAKKASVTARRSGDVSWNGIRNNNLNLLGKPAADQQIRRFLPQTEFVDDETGIRVLHPRTGERTEYVESFDPGAPANWSEKYAVIPAGPGPERGRSVMCLAASGAEHPWALAHYDTGPAHAEDLVRRLRLPSPVQPAAYQVVIRARFKASLPSGRAGSRSCGCFPRIRRPLLNALDRPYVVLPAAGRQRRVRGGTPASAAARPPVRGRKEPVDT